jgi:hypothetical protein
MSDNLIERFTPDRSSLLVGMRPHTHGEYVRYSDHAARITELEQQVERLEEQLGREQAEYNDLAVHAEVWKEHSLEFAELRAGTVTEEAQNLRRLLRLFREFWHKHVAVKSLEASHHHPIWIAIAEALGAENHKAMLPDEYRFVSTGEPLTAALSVQVPPEAGEPTTGQKPNPMTGLWATLTAEQRAAALAYDGPDSHGDPDFARTSTLPDAGEGLGAALSALDALSSDAEYLDAHYGCDENGVLTSEHIRTVIAILRTTSTAPEGWRPVIAEIEAERRRQVEEEGWTAEHDDTHANGALAGAAACYLVHDQPWERQWTGDMPLSCRWPWHPRWFKPKDRRRDLIRAGALLVAEIERIDRAAHPAPEPKP